MLILWMLLQVTGASLTGNVTGPSAATIKAINPATGVVREGITDAAGFYVIPNVTPGSYSVTASSAGFASQTRPEIKLTVGASISLDFKLQLGTVEQKVDVDAPGDGAAVVSGQQAVVGSVEQFADGPPRTMLVTTGCTKIGMGLLVTPLALAEM